jgi:hypothetical protein
VRKPNLLIKSYGSRFGCSVTNCSRHNNLTIKRPAWTASDNVEQVGGIEPHLTAKDTKRTQRNRHADVRHDAAVAFGFDGVARAPCPRPMLIRRMTGGESGIRIYSKT